METRGNESALAEAFIAMHSSHPTATPAHTQHPTIAVAIPCLNEASSIADVVKSFRSELAEARVYVFDNGSTDHSAEIAKNAGAIVYSVPSRGKGCVVRAILNTLTEDIIIMADGDGTYLAKDVHQLLCPIREGRADMVVGNRLRQPESGAISPLHNFGNRLITSMINMLFHAQFQDILSGYRAFNRRLVETVATLTDGFETETELTVRALTEELRIVEIPVSYCSRAVGSQSKLRTFHDGYRILLTAGMLLRDYHPLRIFGLAAALHFVLAACSFGLWIFGPSTRSFVSHPFWGIVAAMAALGGWIALCTGLILNAINTRFREWRQLARRRLDSHE